jgi:antirestriction protein ArdC
VVHADRVLKNRLTSETPQVARSPDSSTTRATVHASNVTTSQCITSSDVCHPSRLNREFVRKRWGDAGYAMEELCAELGAAFLSADLQITPEVREDHAAYIESWLKVLQDDKRAVFSAASHASKAVDFLHGLQPQPAT